MAISNQPSAIDSEVSAVHSKESLRVFVQQDPHRVDAERGAVGQQEQVDGAEHQRGEARPWTMAAERYADDDVCGAPGHRHDGVNPEREGGKAGGHVAAAPASRRRNHRPTVDAEREGPHADRRTEASPPYKEY